MSEGEVAGMPEALNYYHCEACGAPFEAGADGCYSACCNEPAIFGGACDLIGCGHGDYANYYGEWNGREWVAVREEGR